MRKRETLPWGVAAGLLLLTFVLVVHRIVFSPDGLLIFQNSQAPWIMAPEPVIGTLRQWDSERVPITRFSATVFVSDPPSSAMLHVRAMGEFRVDINRNSPSLEFSSSGNWKSAGVAEVADLLRPGPNNIDVMIRNAHGPALLSLRLEGEGLQVKTGTDWLVRVDNRPMTLSMIATDIRPFSGAEGGEGTFEALAAKSTVLLSLFLVSGIAFLLLRSRFDPERFPYLPHVLLTSVAVGWLVLFFTKFVLISPRWGFDADHHIAYVNFLHWQGRIPLATDGWSMYHPPLFYVLTEMVARLVQWGGATAHSMTFIKLLPFLAGLGNVWVTMRLCRRLFVRDTSISLYAIAFAGLLPMNVYMAAYYSNESFHALLFGCCLLVTVGILLDKQVSVPKTVLLSTLLGLALLTKFTAGIITLLAGIFVSFKFWTAYRSRSGELLARLVALAVPMLLVSGWFYARNVAEFGQPFAANWGGLPGVEARTWWTHPGFHTPDYYLSFGASLVQPYFSGFYSFWDSLYSTFWGDGYLGGAGAVSTRHSHWDYGYMATVYLLAVPATLMLLAGGVRAARLALIEKEPGRRAAFGLLVLLPCAFLFSTFFLTLQLPFFGQAKASYSLAVLPSLALFFALGAEGFDRWMANHGWWILRAFFFGWLGTFFAVCYLSFAG